eukprot:1897181-Karenia_brevis.AAC.1
MVTVLEFIAQLAQVPDHIVTAEEAALRKLAPGPGNWISKNDLEHLHLFGIGQGFRTIVLTAKAAKLRLMHDIGVKRICLQAKRIRDVQKDFIRRPFRDWHNCSFAKTLCDNYRELED